MKSLLKSRQWIAHSRARLPADLRPGRLPVCTLIQRRPETASQLMQVEILGASLYLP